jgi:ribosome-binding protein aMBF1 (putative translation factor)
MPQPTAAASPGAGAPDSPADAAPGSPDVRERIALSRQIARAIVLARTAARMSQAKLAIRMGTAQSFVAKLESGRVLPSISTLLRVAQATDTRLRVELAMRDGAKVEVALQDN